jgi:hypothetical protein
MASGNLQLIVSQLLSVTVSVKMLVPHFITFKLKITKKTVQNINPFYIQEALNSVACKVRNASQLKNRTFLVEVQSEKQIEMLLKAYLLELYPVQVERHTSLNSSRGLVSSASLDIMSDEDIQFTFADQSIFKAYRLIWKRDNKPFPEDGCLLGCSDSSP